MRTYADDIAVCSKSDCQRAFGVRPPNGGRSHLRALTDIRGNSVNYVRTHTATMVPCVRAPCIGFSLALALHTSELPDFGGACAVCVGKWISYMRANSCVQRMPKTRNDDIDVDRHKVLPVKCLFDLSPGENWNLMWQIAVGSVVNERCQANQMNALDEQRISKWIQLRQLQGINREWLRAKKYGQMQRNIEGTGTF